MFLIQILTGGSGAMVNELCQHKTQKVAQQTIFGAQSGFKSEEICSEDNKRQYREVSKFCSRKIIIRNPDI